MKANFSPNISGHYLLSSHKWVTLYQALYKYHLIYFPRHYHYYNFYFTDKEAVSYLAQRPTKKMALNPIFAFLKGQSDAGFDSS